MNEKKTSNYIKEMCLSSYVSLIKIDKDSLFEINFE